jgi:hypothetical protein
MGEEALYRQLVVEILDRIENTRRAVGGPFEDNGDIVIWRARLAQLDSRRKSPEVPA